MIDLPCASLAGEGCQAPGELELGGIDDRKVADLQVREQAQYSSSPRAPAASPMQLGSQQPEIVVTRRMQQRDALRGGPDFEAGCGLEVAEPNAVAGDLGAHPRALHQPDLDPAPARKDDRPVGQRMRRDRRDDDRTERRVNDRPAAGERVCRGSRRARDHEPVATVGVDEAAVDADLELDHAARLLALHHDVIERAAFERMAIGVCKPGREQLARVRLVAALEHRVDIADHLVRQHVRQESKAAAIDADERHAATERELGREEQGAVAADRNDEVCLPAKLRDRLSHEPVRQPAD
jgi:hypothetical protein